MGLLSERGVPSWHPAPKPLIEACKKAAAYCKEKNYPIEKLAFQFAVSNPKISTTLFSTSNPTNVKNSVSYINDSIDWDLVQHVKDIIGDEQRVSWANS